MQRGLLNNHKIQFRLTVYFFVCNYVHHNGLWKPKFISDSVD